jgi:hypothetical protein
MYLIGLDWVKGSTTTPSSLDVVAPRGSGALGAFAMRSWCLTPVNKIKAFAIRFTAKMREGQKAPGNLTNQIIDSAVAGKSLACGLRKLSNLA